MAFECHLFLNISAKNIPIKAGKNTIKADIWPLSLLDIPFAIISIKGIMYLHTIKNGTKKIIVNNIATRFLFKLNTPHEIILHNIQNICNKIFQFIRQCCNIATNNSRTTTARFCNINKINIVTKFTSNVWGRTFFVNHKSNLWNFRQNMRKAAEYL